MLTSCLISITVLYLLVIGMLVYGFDKVDNFKLQDLSAKTKFSIVIPFRNEAEHLHTLLDSIAKLNYPKSLFEIILVNDESEDDSVSIIESFCSKQPFKYFNTKHPSLSATEVIHNNRGQIYCIDNIRSSNSPKKDAITSAIQVSKFDWIITTDADCILPKYWLDTFDEYIQLHQPNSIVAPVKYHVKTSFLNRFQSLDFLSLQGATIGGFGVKKPLMCNGANFAYRKSEFISVNGFEGNDSISSGDDLFLLQKFLEKDAKKVQYLKSVKTIVTTQPAKNFDDLVQQRLRWASKTSHYKSWFVKLVGVIVLLGNLAILALILAVLLEITFPKIAAALVVIKFSIDFLLLFKTARFFKQENVLLSYVFASLLYPFFNVSIAFLSFFTSYRWKGRTFKK
ncbi:MAG: glycosyltransferase [Winogradskyella sp.]|uniref:glycosyltransferase family 2 protein n=1 Tax=Winogradskyella sp. TaxID=1883156 RepID=UPI0038587C4A